MFAEKLREMLSTPTEKLGKTARFGVFQYKIWKHCIRQLIINRAREQAAALSYQTIFGIVPVVIVMIMIFQAIPSSSQVSGRLKNAVYEQMHLSAVEIPDPEKPGEKMKLTEHLEGIMQKFFSEESRGKTTLLSTLFIIYAAIGLLSTIEATFNTICHVSQGRSFLARIVNYWAILTLGPLLIGAAIYVSTTFSAFGQVQSFFAPAIINYVISVIGLFLLYLVMPNVRLGWKSTLWGAAVAALVWSIVKAGFGFYVVEYRPYSNLYGAMALVPLSVFWVFITWLIVLFGLELSYTTQHLSTLEDAERIAAHKNQHYFIGGDVSTMNIMAFISAAYSSRHAPVTMETICSRLNMPAEFAEKMLPHLVKCKLLMRTSDPIAGYVPATDARNIKLSDIARAVDDAGIAHNATMTRHATMQMREASVEKFSEHTLEELAKDWS
jgi:membrane protein